MVTDIPFTDHEASVVFLKSEVLMGTGREIVDDANGMARIDTGVHEMRTDKSCTTSDQYFHRQKLIQLIWLF